LAYRSLALALCLCVYMSRRSLLCFLERSICTGLLLFLGLGLGLGRGEVRSLSSCLFLFFWAWYGGVLCHVSRVSAGELLCRLVCGGAGEGIPPFSNSITSKHGSHMKKRCCCSPFNLFFLSFLIYVYCNCRVSLCCCRGGSVVGGVDGHAMADVRGEQRVCGGLRLTAHVCVCVCLGV
jgi:hypothetical protein